MQQRFGASRRAVLLVVVVTSLAGVATALTPEACGDVAGTRDLLRAGSVLLLGEIHGTQEAPAAVEHLVCLALEGGLHVTVGLELPQEAQPGIDTYLNSEDDSSSRRTLLSGEFWQRDYQDGRTSAAMYELLIELHRHRNATDRVNVMAIDHPTSRLGRDAFMASRLRARIARHPDEVIVVLTGNLHNRLTVGTRFAPELEPMGYLLSQSAAIARRLVSLRLSHRGGAAWICTGSDVSDCGERELDARARSPLGVSLFPNRDEDRSFSGEYQLGRVTASAPAKGVAAP